jgi:hypothetical protein
MENKSISDILKGLVYEHRNHKLITPDGDFPLVTAEYIIGYNEKLKSPNEIKGGASLSFPILANGKLYKHVSLTVKPLIGSSNELKVTYGNEQNLLKN